MVSVKIMVLPGFGIKAEPVPPGSKASTKNIKYPLGEPQWAPNPFIIIRLFGF